MSDFKSLLFGTEFLESFAGRNFTAADRAAFLKALELLDSDDKHPSLRVHLLEGDKRGIWSASATRALRLLFTRAPDGKKRLIACTRHYDR